MLIVRHKNIGLWRCWANKGLALQTWGPAFEPPDHMYKQNSNDDKNQQNKQTNKTMKRRNRGCASNAGPGGMDTGWSLGSLDAQLRTLGKFLASQRSCLKDQDGQYQELSCAIHMGGHTNEHSNNHWGNYCLMCFLNIKIIQKQVSLLLWVYELLRLQNHQKRRFQMAVTLPGRIALSLCSMNELVLATWSRKDYWAIVWLGILSQWSWTKPNSVPWLGVKSVIFSPVLLSGKELI